MRVLGTLDGSAPDHPKTIRVSPASVMENVTFYSERQVGDLVAIKEFGHPGKKRTDGDDVIGHFIHPANARNRILHTGLGKNRMAYQIRKPANQMCIRDRCYVYA